MIQSFKAIFFDAGGTLLHPYPSVGEIYRTVALRYGCDAEAGFLEKAFHETWLRRDGLAALVSHFSEKIEKNWWRGLVHEVFSLAGGVDNFESFFEELYHQFASPDVWKLYPETLEVLQALKKRGKRVGIISNWDSRLFHLCEGLGVDTHVDFILASAVFGASKPSEKIFKEALSRARVLAQEALHVGDSLEDDIRGAQRAGIEAVLIDRAMKRKDIDSKPLRPPRVIRNLHELLG